MTICGRFHIFGFDPDAPCDICGKTREELGVDMMQWALEWESRILAMRLDKEITNEH